MDIRARLALPTAGGHWGQGKKTLDQLLEKKTARLCQSTSHRITRYATSTASAAAYRHATIDDGHYTRVPRHQPPTFSPLRWKLQRDALRDETRQNESLRRDGSDVNYGEQASLQPTEDDKTTQIRSEQSASEEPNPPSPDEATDQFYAEARRFRDEWSRGGNFLLGKPVPRRNRRKSGAKMTKSWTKKSPNTLLHQFFAATTENTAISEQVAMLRGIRLPVVLMQLRLRNLADAYPDDYRHILDSLPSAKEWNKVLKLIESNGHDNAALHGYLDVLLGHGDQEKCQRFLHNDTFKPIFLYNFLLRKQSFIKDATTVDELLQYFQKWYSHDGTEQISDGFTRQRSRHGAHNMDVNNLIQTFSLLAYHCRRLEPRLLIKLANVMVQEIEARRRWLRDEARMYLEKCSLFNAGLEMFADRAGMGGNHRESINLCAWEAQQILLDMSSRLPKPLTVNGAGFRSIRSVMSGLGKNSAEVHSAFRHSQTWPPYLRPGDGMDERMDTEDAWSRTVKAGMMMQEAGFSKTGRDESLDILQGMGPDGTPTIQQRTAVVPQKELRVWEASITATRNAQEAWERFQNPPEEGRQPGVEEYAAMFRKLFARAADPHRGFVSGDNAASYPTREETNLTEFEKTRLQPPSVDELYQSMQLQGVAPTGACLEVLVANAESLETAHKYLMDGAKTKYWYQNLINADTGDDEAVRQIPRNIFTAYIGVCVKEPRDAGRHLRRAIRLAKIRLEAIPRVSEPHVWSHILGGLGRNHETLGLSIDEQLQLTLELLDELGSHRRLPLSLFHSFTWCLRRIIRRQVVGLEEDVKPDKGGETHPLWSLYDLKPEEPQDVECEATDSEQAKVEPRGEQPLVSLIRLAAMRMKMAFWALVSENEENASLFSTHDMPPVDWMLSRRDPVTASYAHGYMQFLVYAGESEEAADVTKWLLREWGQPLVAEELERLDFVPPVARILDTLCAYRAYAEPMLGPGTTRSVIETLHSTQIDWIWPDDAAMAQYMESRVRHGDDTLDRVLRLVRLRQRQR